MRKRIFYSIFMALLLITGCYKEEFGQVEKEMKNLRDTQIAPLNDQISRISESISTLNVLSEELQEYVTQIEQAGGNLQDNIDRINESIQKLREELSGENSSAKGEVLARLENTKSYLEVQLADMKSTSSLLQAKYDSLQQQIEALESLVANGYATKDWVNGTFATIAQQNAVIADVEAVSALISQLSSSTFEIEGNIKEYIKKLRDTALSEVQSSVSQNVKAVIEAYELAISEAVSDIKNAYSKEIADAIKKSEDKVMAWVNKELNDYLTLSAAGEKVQAYKDLIGNVPEGLSLQGQIDTLSSRIETLKADITDAYKAAIEEAIKTSEGKLTDQLTGGIASFRANDLKNVTDDVTSLEEDVKTLWEDLGMLESRIKTLEEQAAAIEESLDVLKGFHNSLEEYIDALKAELLEKDKTEAATLQELVEALQYAVNGEDNASSLDAMIAELKAYVGTIPEGETSLVAWVESSTALIGTQLKDYATIEYINGLKKEVNDTIADHTRRLEIVSGRLATAIDDSKSTVEGWISDSLKDYMKASVFNGKLQTLDTYLKKLFTQGDSALSGKISDLRTAVGTAISELQVAYKAKIKSSIEKYNGYVTSSVDTKLSDVKKVLYGEDGKGGINAQFEEFEATIDGMKSDVQTLNTEISSLKAKVNSLKTFITVEGYSSLKGIVGTIDAELGKLTGLYADLSKFNSADLAVNGTGGYKESIDKLAQFKTDLEAAETAIDTYQTLLKDFNLTDKDNTLKKQFDALTKELADLKTSVFGSGTGNSLRDKIKAIVSKDAELKAKITDLNSSLLSRVQSFTSIAFRPETEDGSAKFNFDGTTFSSTLYFDVRPKALSDAIAKAAEIQWIHTATRALVSLNSVSADITSPAPGTLKADVSFKADAMRTISNGISLALFASGTGFDFASEFIPVSGDRMYTDKTVLYAPALGTDKLKVKLFYPTEATPQTPQTSEKWVSVSNGSSATGVSGLSCREYTVTVGPSKQLSERTAAITFKVSLSRGQSLSCSVDVIQEAREMQKITKFDPDTLIFSWNGHILDEEDKPTGKTSQDIIVTTSDSQTDWDVKETTETDWFSVEHLDGQNSTKARVSFVAGSQNKNYNTTGKNRTGSITFTSATGQDTTFLFTQKFRGEQKLTFDPSYNSEDGSGGLSFGYEKTENRNGSRKAIGVISSDLLYDYNVEVDTQYPWIHIDQSQDKQEVRVWTDANDNVIDEEKGELSRTGYITFTTQGSPSHTYQYPVVQANCPPQSFLFSPRDGQNCYLGEDGLIHISFRGGSKMYVYVKGDPNDDWTMTVNDAGTGDWLSREELTNKSGRSEASLAPAGFKYYIRITAKEYSGDESTTKDREASIRFTCDGKTYDYKVIQDHKTADIINFAPASGTLVFSWFGKVIGTDGKPTSDDYQDIEVTTGNETTNWTVQKTPEFSWAAVAKRTGYNANMVRISDVEDNKTGKDRTGTLTFTSATNKTYTYTFTQLTATETTASVTIGDKSVDKIILSWDGKQYRTSDADSQWKDITTRNVNGVQTFLATVTIGDGSEWSAALDPTKTSSGWSVAATRVLYGQSIISTGDYYLGLSGYGSNTNESSRSAEIVISNDFCEIRRITVVQEGRPAQSFTFSPELTFQDYKAGTITTAVTSSPALENDEWEVTNGTIGGWLTVERVNSSRRPYGATNQIKLTATKNDTPEPRTAKLVITYDGGSVEYTVTQPGRKSQTFESFSPDNGTVYFSWDGYVIGSDGKSTSSTTQDITVTTSDGETDWKVDITNTSWATVEHRTNQNANKARITVGKGANNANCNLTGEDREGFITFTSANDPNVTSTYKFIQKARPAMTFTFSPSYIEIIKDYKNSSRQYRTSSDGKFTDVPYDIKSWSYYITLTVGVEGGTADDWTCEPISGSEWASAEKNKGTIRITPKNANNTGAKQEIVISIKDNTTKEQVATYTFYKQGRTPYVFTDLTDKEYEWNETSGSFTVSTDPSGDSNRDWKVKVLDMDGNAVSAGFWLNATTADNNNTVSLTMSENNTGDPKQAKLLFYTFEGETASSAKTIVITQKARPAQTFTAPTEGRVFEYDFFKQTNMTIDVTTSDGLKDWKLGDVTLNEGSGWLTVSKKADGSGLSVNINANDGSERTATVKLLPYDEAVSGTRTFVIKQKAPQNISLAFNETSWNLGYAGGQKGFTISSDPAGYADWEVESSAAWLTATKNASGSLTLTASENTEFTPRTATVSFSNSSPYVTGSNTITITQAKLITLQFETTSLSWAGNKEPEAQNVKVICSTAGYNDWNVQSDDESFIVTKNDDGTVSIRPKGTHTYNILPLDDKIATISFTQSIEYKALNSISCIQTCEYCLAAGTRISMADGSYKKIEDIKEGDLVRTFDHEAGRISYAKICLTYKGDSKAIPLILTFASGKKLSIVGTHDLLLQNTRKYVRINSGNVSSFVGKSFYNAESGKWDKLISYKFGTTPVEYYCIYSTRHLNCIAEGMLTVPDDEDYFLNIYELDANLKADPVQLAADIKKYGLMDVAKDYPQYKQYKELVDALLCQYLYIVLGKGLATQDDVDRMLNSFWDELE